MRRMDKNVLVFLFALQYNPLFCYPLKVTFNSNHDEARFINVFLLAMSLCWGGLPAAHRKWPVFSASSVFVLCHYGQHSQFPQLETHSTQHECARQTLLKLSRWRPRRCFLRIMDSFIMRRPLEHRFPGLSSCLCFSICFFFFPPLVHPSSSSRPAYHVGYW